MRGSIGGGEGAVVLDEIAEVTVLLLTDGRLQGHRLLGDLDDLPHLLRRYLHIGADFLAGGLTTVLLHQAAADSHQLVDRLHHVHRDADGARLVGDGAGDGLPDPPGGVGAEFVALTVVELLHRPDEADVALLDEVQQGHAPSDVLLGHADHESEVGLGQALLTLEAVLLDLREVAAEALLVVRQLLVQVRLGRQKGLLAASGHHGQSHQLWRENVGDDGQANQRALCLPLLDGKALRHALS